MSPDVAVSPVDGRVLNYGAVSDGRIDQVKGRSYRVDELLDSSVHAKRFENGHYVTVYLSPADYHRIHCPAEGKITGYRYIPGRLYPVNSLGVNNIDGVFAVNERLISFVNTSLGEMAVVKVGATNVGSISVTYAKVRTNLGQKTAYDEALKKKKRVERAGELGSFHLGSTVVLVVANPDLKPAVELQLGEYRLLGQPLLRLA